MTPLTVLGQLLFDAPVENLPEVLAPLCSLVRDPSSNLEAVRDALDCIGNLFRTATDECRGARSDARTVCLDRIQQHLRGETTPAIKTLCSALRTMNILLGGDALDASKPAAGGGEKENAEPRGKHSGSPSKGDSAELGFESQIALSGFISCLQLCLFRAFRSAAVLAKDKDTALGGEQRPGSAGSAPSTPRGGGGGGFSSAPTTPRGEQGDSIYGNNCLVTSILLPTSW